MIGIYKITAPNGKVYIGQSTEIENRWNRYKKLQCKRQSKLYNSFLKYGIDNFQFNVLFEIKIKNVNILNKVESAYINFFDSMNNGLNCTSGGEGYEVSIESKLKMSIASKGKKKKPFTDEHKQKLSEAKKGKIPPNKGVPMSIEQKLKLSEKTKLQWINKKINNK